MDDTTYILTKAVKQLSHEINLRQSCGKLTNCRFKELPILASSFYNCPHVTPICADVSYLQRHCPLNFTSSYIIHYYSLKFI